MLAGLMQPVPLTMNLIRERMAALYPNKTVTTRYPSGIRTASYEEVLTRAGGLANFLKDCGLERGARVATLAWNSQRHLELYLAVPCMGAVLHTINARLASADITNLLAHAQDRVLFVDKSIWRTHAGLQLPDCVRHVVLMEDETAQALTSEAAGPGVAFQHYEDMLKRQSSDFAWPVLDENEAAGLCYTSGTTGDPKGVLYSHRSTTLHTMSCLFADGIAMRERDVCMPAVPMFHANGWGFPYAALLAGASLALPCRETDPRSLVELIAQAKVTMATAVPSVWLAFLEHLKSDGAAREEIASLERLPIGGAAVSGALIDGFAGLGIDVMHCWGMTEISPLGLTNFARSDLDAAERSVSRTAQGLPIPGCTLRIVEETGARCPHDGVASGELQISSPWAAAGYFDGVSNAQGARPALSFVTDEGRDWLRTGDIATIDMHGYVRIVDRAKDLIKSGGEWISSQALEFQLMNHPDVREAAAVARPDPKWQERPVACICLHTDTAESRARFEKTLRGYLLEFFPKWQIPDEVMFWSELPKGKTGKIDKITLRKLVAGQAE